MATIQLLIPVSRGLLDSADVLKSAPIPWRNCPYSYDVPFKDHSPDPVKAV